MTDDDTIHSNEGDEDLPESELPPLAEFTAGEPIPPEPSPPAPYPPPAFLFHREPVPVEGEPPASEPAAPEPPASEPAAPDAPLPVQFTPVEPAPPGEEPSPPGTYRPPGGFLFQRPGPAGEEPFGEEEAPTEPAVPEEPMAEDVAPESPFPADLTSQPGSGAPEPVAVPETPPDMPEEPPEEPSVMPPEEPSAGPPSTPGEVEGLEPAEPATEGTQEAPAFKIDDVSEVFGEGVGEGSGNYTGTLLADRYEIDELTSRTAMAETYKATDVVLGTVVAVKFLSLQLAADRAFAEQFTNEALSAAKVSSPYVVQVLDAGTVGELRYVVQELVRGETLAQLLRREGKVEPERASQIAEQVLSGLAAAHAAGVTHQDVNPGTILILPSGDAKVMDLGSARVESPHTIAQTRAIMGTAAYLSPEQAQGEKPDARSDIYSAGIVLYEMLAGKPPFSADSPVALAYMHVRDVPQPLSETAPGISSELSVAVMHALGKAPEDRYQTAAQFKEALEHVRVGETPKPEPEKKRPRVSTPAGPETLVFAPAGGGAGISGRTRILIGVVILAAAVIAGYYFLAMPHDVVIPNVTGLKTGQAQQSIEDLGLASRTLPQETTEAGKVGTVVGQTPPADTKVPKGTIVILTVGQAPSSVVVPDLTDLTQAAAGSAIRSAGLTVGKITQESSDSPAGTVLGQDPAIGTTVPVGVPVNLTVAVAAKHARVPDLICLSATQASALLKRVDLQMTIAGVKGNAACPADGKPRIALQTPSAGEKALTGGLVAVWTTMRVPTPANTPAPFSPVPSSPSP